MILYTRVQRINIKEYVEEWNTSVEEKTEKQRDEKTYEYIRKHEKILSSVINFSKNLIHRGHFLHIIFTKFYYLFEIYLQLIIHSTHPHF